MPIKKPRPYASSSEDPLFAFALTQATMNPKAAADDVTQWLDSAHDKADAISEGDLACLEELLLAQALRADAIATHLSDIGLAHIKGSAFAKSLKLIGLSMKCQNESRKAIATLAELKNPSRTTFVKNQQNNLIQSPQLLEPSQNAPLDFGSKRSAKAASETIEAVAEVHGR
jgi:hypothetical protein